MSKYVPFNINHKVRVKLTDYGRDILAEQYVRFWERSMNTNPPGYVPIEEDENGWSEWQLRYLMVCLGDRTRQGSKLAFESNIEVEIESVTVLHER